MDKPTGTYQCVVCDHLWDGSQLYQDPQSLGGKRWTCGDIRCGGNVKKISDQPLLSAPPTTT
ncbi:MAG: hypothetical protein WC497_02145 [Patescibacteria group bacterium]